MVRVLNPIGLYDFNLIANFNREMHAQYTVALFYLLEYACIEVGEF
jgi:hypothetical protein